MKDIIEKIDGILSEEREGKYFKKGDTVVWKAPDGTTLQGTVVSGDIRGKLKVSYDNNGKKVEVLVPTNKAKKFDAKGIKKRMKSGSAAMFHYDTM